MLAWPNGLWHMKHRPTGAQFCVQKQLIELFPNPWEPEYSKILTRQINYIHTSGYLECVLAPPPPNNGDRPGAKCYSVIILVLGILYILRLNAFCYQTWTPPQLWASIRRRIWLTATSSSPWVGCVLLVTYPKRIELYPKRYHTGSTQDSKGSEQITKPKPGQKRSSMFLTHEVTNLSLSGNLHRPERAPKIKCNSPTIKWDSLSANKQANWQFT